MSLEIGSEFTSNILQSEANCIDSILPNPIKVLSGRTALSLILDDLLLQDINRKVYVPSYCCDSMLEPFIRKGFSLKFYTVAFDNVTGFSFEYDFGHGCDIVLLLHYFGYNQIKVSEILTQEKKALIIQDITHSIFSAHGFSSYADYWFCSFRKWTWLPGIGIAWKKNVWTQLPYLVESKPELIKYRKAAQRLKEKYLKNGIEENFEGLSYLPLFQRAEELLENESEHCVADDDSIHMLAHLDINSLIIRRRSNAEHIYSRLHDAGVSERLIFEGFDSLKDVPLFIPIRVRGANREKILKALIDAKVYVPQHWPISNYLPPSLRHNGLYNEEISLVCDQRYTEEDMSRQCDVLITALSKFK